VSRPTKVAAPAPRGRDAIVHELRARLGPLLALLSVLFAVSAPLAFFVMGARELQARGRTTAHQAAETLARYAEEQPVLWRYDSLKLVEHLRHFETQSDVVRIDVVDARGGPIDPGFERPREGLLWGWAPFGGGGRGSGAGWVGSSRTTIRQRAVALLGGFALLSMALSILVYAIALRSARAAEARIARLVEELAARSTEERVRALRLAAIAAQEEDRRAIARDLHDSVGQSLTAIRIQTELLGAHLGRGEAGSREAATTLAAQIARSTDTTLEEVRRALARLRPAALDEIGLAQATERLCDDLAEQLGVEVVRVLVVPEGLPTAVETAVYRIVQEALTNVARHARGATRLRIAIRAAGDHLRIEVEDDGPGLPLDGSGQGRGMIGMRERAELLGGRLETSAAEPHGTRIVAEVPIAP